MSSTRHEIERMLPGFMQRAAESNAPLQALLEAMAELPRPDVERFEQLDALFDPRRTPERFVPFLARWVDLGRVFEVPPPFQPREGRAEPGIGQIGGSLRELIARAATLSQWRGTRRGLVHFLEAATGIVGFEIEEEVEDAEGLPRPFHIRLLAPESARDQEGLIRRVLAMEKPAHVTAELVFVVLEGST